jgi:hypothetical protein
LYKIGCGVIEIFIKTIPVDGIGIQQIISLYAGFPFTSGAAIKKGGF